MKQKKQSKARLIGIASLLALIGMLIPVFAYLMSSSSGPLGQGTPPTLVELTQYEGEGFGDAASGNNGTDGLDLRLFSDSPEEETLMANLLMEGDYEVSSTSSYSPGQGQGMSGAYWEEMTVVPLIIPRGDDDDDTIVTAANAMTNPCVPKNPCVPMDPNNPLPDGNDPGPTTMAPIPEPGSMALFGAGLAILAGALRRRSTQA